MITPKDVVLALSWSGETAELKSLIDYSRRFRIPLIAVTAVADSGLGKAADVVIQMPPVREACPHNLAPTTSALLQLVIGDALAIALLDSKGFSERDFHVFHPAGRLGAMLKFVRDYMYVGARLPLIQSGARMADAIVEISARGIGCVGVVDKEGLLIGIITDGDLRRHMQPGLLELPVDQVMTKNPKTTAPEQLASGALQQLNASKVHVLFVTEAGKPVGIVHVHELLRAGVA
jgi:arabinose-5-phosphate isomerase